MTSGRDPIHEAIDLQNARSLDGRMTHLELTYGRRVGELEAKVATLEGLVGGMQGVLGQYLQDKLGHGSTVEDADGDHR